MHKEMIHKFFLLQTHRVSTWTTKLSPFKLVPHRNLTFRCRQAKNQTFVAALDFQTDLAATSQQSIASTYVEENLLTEKEPLELTGHTTSSLTFGKTSLAARPTNCNYYPLPIIMAPHKSQIPLANFTTPGTT